MLDFLKTNRFLEACFRKQIDLWELFFENESIFELVFLFEGESIFGSYFSETESIFESYFKIYILHISTYVQKHAESLKTRTQMIKTKNEKGGLEINSD